MSSSSKHVSKYRDRTRSRSPDRRDPLKRDRRHKSPSPKRTHKSRNKDRSKSPKRKPKSSSREKTKNKKSKKKKKNRNSSSSSSSESDQELNLLQRLETERLRLKEEKNKQKELMKLNETPEEKRARRLKEKQEKEKKRRERMGWDNEYQCYTDQDNPFGDSALTNTFVWSKKLAKEGVKNVSREELETLNRQKQLENKVELEKVKQRRLEREAERADREAEASAAARAREAAQFSSWARQEDAFHLHQAKLRSQIRIRDGRAKPIDLLAWYLSSEGCVDALEMHEPYTYLNGLQEADLEDLREDIQVYKELEKEGEQVYWEDVESIVCDELDKIRRHHAPRDSLHRAVADDVATIFKGKSGAQLSSLRSEIERKLQSRAAGLDTNYWESLLSQLKAHMARARLRERHQDNLRRKLRLLKEEQGVDSRQEARGDSQCDASTSAVVKSRSPSPDASSPQPDAEADGEDGAEAEADSVALYLSGRYSPEPLAARVLEPGTMLISPEDDEQRLAYLRAGTRNASVGASVSASIGTAEASVTRTLGTEGAPFGGEMTLAPQTCIWADKHRPRKPRYFNRVHTGFEWNKYNQTHYDMDNPPPKIVQGYKFNIFYPDLIDPSATPSFSLKACGEQSEFAVLRFHAGPPYEDIAFKIVNREWEYSYKRGFRCHFHNNVFQLWFHFKRYRYRR